MTENEYNNRRELKHYHIDGLNKADIWENISNPGTIEWKAGVDFHRQFVNICSNQNSKYKKIRLTYDTNISEDICTIAILDRVSI